MNQHLTKYNLKEQRQENGLHADGFVDVSGIQPLFTYHLKDHLGNVRMGSSGIFKQSNDYYPFCMAYSVKIRNLQHQERKNTKSRAC